MARTLACCRTFLATYDSYLLTDDRGAQQEVNWRFSGKPIFITETGIVDAADTKRPRFLLDHLVVLHQAIQEGIPVVGYCHWSLMDNFEWIEGFRPRYGLYAVDYRTRTLTLRDSGKLYAKIAEENAISK